MRIHLNKIQAKIKKNLELILLSFLILVTITSTQIYNLNKKKINKNYIELVNNIYFQKTLEHIFNNFKRKFVAYRLKL